MANPRPEAERKEVSLVKGNSVLAMYDGATIAELTKIEREIKKERDKVIGVAAKGYLKMGALLADARLHFAGDAEFGAWREERLGEISQKQAYAMMRAYDVAKEAPALVEACGLSVLQEIAYGGPGLIKWAAERVAAGAPITVKDVREVKGSPPDVGREEIPPGWGAGGNGKPAKVAEGEHIPAADVKRPDPQARYKKVLKLDIGARYKLIGSDYTGERLATQGYLLMGVDPDPSCPMSEDTLAHLIAFVAKQEFENIGWVDCTLDAVKKDQAEFDE